MKNLVSHRLFWPAVVLAALLVANFLSNHSFFTSPCGTATYTVHRSTFSGGRPRLCWSPWG